MKTCHMIYQSHVGQDDMILAYDMILESKALSSVFYDGSCRTVEDFLDTFSQPDMHSWLLFYEGSMAGLAWLNGRVHRRAHAHFCMFSNVYGRSSDGLSKSVRLGRFCVASWLNHTNKCGVHLIDVIVGVTPARNRMAVKWVQRVGFVRQCTVPLGVWMHDSGESEDAVLSTATRDTVDPAWVDY